uniref:Putative transmembrane protein encoded by LINC00862 n=1 Tax=Homo sapiens TaxID=9606 RepID=SIM16_HUMAN|nr:RecName: Full=Putative transmembrane protein encoded by LINC00862; AltName: Full=Small integral membrane protein 16 [Homo sapiens]
MVCYLYWETFPSISHLLKITLSARDCHVCGLNLFIFMDPVENQALHPVIMALILMPSLHCFGNILILLFLKSPAQLFCRMSVDLALLFPHK